MSAGCMKQPDCGHSRKRNPHQPTFYPCDLDLFGVFGPKIITAPNSVTCVGVEKIVLVILCNNRSVSNFIHIG